MPVLKVNGKEKHYKYTTKGKLEYLADKKKKKKKKITKKITGSQAGSWADSSGGGEGSEGG